MFRIQLLLKKFDNFFLLSLLSTLKKLLVLCLTNLDELGWDGCETIKFQMMCGFITQHTFVFLMFRETVFRRK